MVFVADHHSPFYLSFRETVLFLHSNKISSEERINAVGQESSTCHHSHGHGDFPKGQKALSSIAIISSLCELVE